MQTVSRLISAWPLVARRGLAHWRLLSSVVIGVVLASAIMAGTVIYFNALRELALKNSLAKLNSTEANILVRATRGPTSYREQEKVSRAMNREFSRVAWLLKDRLGGGRTATFFLARPGNEQAAGRDDSRAYFAFVPRLEEHIALLPGGRYPQERALSAPKAPLELEAIIPLEAAVQFELRVGDRLSAVPYWDDVIPYASVVVSGIFKRNDPGQEYWQLDDNLFQASFASFQTVPFYISEKTFMEVVGAAFRDVDTTYGWLLDVEPSRLNAANASLARFNIELMERRLATDLFSFQQITSLDKALADYDQRLFFSKLPMFIILVLIAVVILYYVMTISSLLVEQQRGEISLLRSRGASSAQILSVFVLEGATISILAIVVAPVLAALVISVLGFTPAFSELSGNDRLEVSLSGGAYMMSALGGILSFSALLIPAIQASRIEVVRHRQQTARPSSQPFFQRYYLDVLLLVVSVILFRQLTERGSVVATGVFGEVAVDQILLAVPALVLVAFAMVMLRLFPLAIRFLSGDSPALVSLVVAGTVLILVPTIALREAVGGGGLMWLAQVALLAALAGVYAATDRDRRMPLKLVGIAAQAGLVALALRLGPTLPLHQVFAPMLIGIVIAQAAFALLKSFAQRAPVWFSMALWQMARNPTHYARLSLLLILMAGLGIFAASFGGTLSRSFKERALYSTGADIRVEGLLLDHRGPTRPVVESYKRLPGVQQASPVFRGFGSDLSKLLGENYEMLAMDGEAFTQVAWFRDDFSRRPIKDLLASLDSPTLPQGLALPANARTLAVTLKPDAPHPGVAVTARVRDANDRYFTYFLGNLTSDDWMELRAGLARTDRFGNRLPLEPVYPLTLASLSFHEVDGRTKLRAGSATIDKIHVETASGEDRIIEPFDDVVGWNILRVIPDAASDSLQPSIDTLDGGDGGSGAAAFSWSGGSSLISRGIYYGPPLAPLPALASKSFLRDTNHVLGDELEVSVAGHRVPVRLVDTIDYFPTLDTINDRFLVSELAGVSRYANLETTASELRPNEIWLSTQANGAERRRLLETLEENQPFTASVIHDRVEALAESRVDPLVEAGWRALLFIAFSAVLILSALGFLVHAYVSFRSREAQFALMRTIGFSMKQVITLVWLEQALVILAGMALGTWMGGRLGALIMPFLGHDDRGGQVLPPFVLEVSWGSLAITYGAMALVFVLITMGLIWFIQRISLQRILRLGEM